MNFDFYLIPYNHTAVVHGFIPVQTVIFSVDGKTRITRNNLLSPGIFYWAGKGERNPDKAGAVDAIHLLAHIGGDVALVPGAPLIADTAGQPD